MRGGDASDDRTYSKEKKGPNDPYRRIGNGFMTQVRGFARIFLARGWVGRGRGCSGQP